MGNLNTGLTREQMSERGRRAGLKSAEVRRERKRMREWAEIIGEIDTTVINADGEEKTMPYIGAVVTSMYNKAVNEQDVRAAEFIAKLMGEMKEQVSVEGKMQGLTVVVENPDTAEKLEKILNQ